jgi:hypothetical protein
MTEVQYDVCFQTNFNHQDKTGGKTQRNRRIEGQKDRRKERQKERKTEGKKDRKKERQKNNMTFS